MKLETRLIYEQKGNENNSVSCPIHVSTTFEIADTQHFELSGSDKNEYTYSRFGTPVLRKLEQALSALEDDCSALTYSSGMSVAHAVIECIFPKRILISSRVFLGVQNMINHYMRDRNVKKYLIEHDMQAAIDDFEENDVVWLESPRNPKGEIVDIKAFRKMFPAPVIIIVDS
jgi:cystathionine beta-lyase/cystathionine gamma-synthase